MSSSLPSALPTPCLTFLQWLKNTESRDKLYRLVAYGSKVPIYLLKAQQPENKDLVSRLSKGASSVGMTRKLMRMFRSLEFLNDSLKALTVNDSVERGLSLIKGISLMVWMIADHLQWLSKAGYFKLSNQAGVDRLHSQAWFVGLLTGAALSAYKLQPIMDQVKAKEAQGAKASEIAELKSKEKKTAQGLVKNLVDLIIPSTRLGWIPATDLHVGIAGTFTSIIGILDTWPSNKAK